MSDWQPIESAPKDGTTILICFKENPKKIRKVKWYGNFWSESNSSGWWDKTILGWIPCPTLSKKKPSYGNMATLGDIVHYDSETYECIDSQEQTFENITHYKITFRKIRE